MVGRSDTKRNGSDATATSVANSEVMTNAGKIRMDEPQDWGIGIINDFKSTVGTHWVQEVTNFNQRTIAVSLVMYISVVAPALTFGAVYYKETENRIGAVEVILATSWVGVAYSIIGGMPLCVIGSTGPVVAFAKAIVRMAGNMGVPYLTLNAWISAWLLLFCFTAAFFDLTRLVRMATSFTDEIFALLIVSIFVMDAVGDPFSQVGVLRYFDPNHESHVNYEDDPYYDYMSVALLSTLIGLGTTALIFCFRSFKTSSFFCNQGVRNSIYDFAVSLSVLIMTLVKEFCFPNVDTEQLNVPDQFEPTFQCCDRSCNTFFPDQCPEQDAAWGARSWFVDFTDLNGNLYVPIVTIFPAMLAFLLLFLDNGITWHLIYHPNNSLKHGHAYNYDLVLSGVFNFINGIFGLPWLVATTVPCIVHLNSLADKDKDGKIIAVQETRLTMFFSHLLVGLSLLFLDALRILPVPVLYGVFLFMGLSALPAMQFWNRILLWFMQPSRYPKTVYVEYLQKKRLHFYTAIQLFFFALVFLVQNFKAVSIAFPLMTLLCIPARTLFLPRFFEGWELCLLDGCDREIAAWVERKRHLEGFGEDDYDDDSSDEMKLRMLSSRSGNVGPDEIP